MKKTRDELLRQFFSSMINSMPKIIGLFSTLVMFISPKVTLATDAISESEYSNLEEVVANLSFQSVIIASALLFLLTVISLVIKKPKNWLKTTLFVCVIVVTLATTFFLSGATIYLNMISVSKGPVHWHADFEIWTCGQEVDLKNPKGLSNKIGTASLHEHNDKRIHLEGVQVEHSDASLGKFFDVIGGHISRDSIAFPTDDGIKEFGPGTGCSSDPDAKLQVFVYKVFGKKVVQEKLGVDPSTYIITGEGQVPNGDCIIIEYDREKDKTERLCRSYTVAKEIGKLDK